MPRTIQDIADLYLPQRSAPDAASEREAALARGPVARPRRPVALPILTLPIASDDFVRNAYAWNLAVELARLGAHTTLVAPTSESPPWPDTPRGPLGVRVDALRDASLEALASRAVDAAIAGAAEAAEGGVVLVALAPEALFAAESIPRSLLRWLLLFTTPDSRDLREAYALAKRAYRRGSDPLVGVVLHGVQRLDQAARAFGRVADVALRHLGRAPQSYGLLADDLHVYRAISAERSIGLEHPQSRAARALGDVAGMIWEDAQKRALV